MRILRAARSLDVPTVGIHSEDDAGALHALRCDELVALPGVGPAAYLDIAAVVGAAVSTGATAVHPGYGLLSESAELARACQQAGMTFVGPSPEVLDTFGDKAEARRLAEQEHVPVVPGTNDATSLEAMTAFAREHLAAASGAVMIKALAGGGGRGMRVVRSLDELPGAFEVCRAEALSAFGRDDLYVERLQVGARHIEVQVVGDGTGAVSHLWDRDCSVQRRHQKLIEVAPSRLLPELARAEMLTAAVRLTAAARLRGVATVEFLALPSGEFAFLEVNPRLQVEHTVTEQVTGVDLVATQLWLASGATLEDLGLTQHEVGPAVGCAIQVRLNAETTLSDGSLLPSSGTLTEFAPAMGAGVRVDTAALAGTSLNPRFDSLLAKVVVHDRSGFDAARRLALQALEETHIVGVATNLGLQTAVLETGDFAASRCDTGWFDRHVAALTARPGEPSPRAGTAEHAADPRAVRAAIGGVVVSVDVAPGQTVDAGAVLVVLEAMKMQHPVTTDRPGRIDAVHARPGDVLSDGDVLLLIDSDDGPGTAATETPIDLDQVRPDLQAILDRRASLLDGARPAAVDQRHQRGGRTARENVDDLTDAGLEVEYGGFAVAAQRENRSLDDLVARTPADGIITGLGRVNGALLAPEVSTCAIAAYDATVLAGSQGVWGHHKLDRLLDVAHARRYPVVLFTEGAGGRPSDTDVPLVAGLHLTTWVRLGALSGLVPTIGIVNGYCFAGNAALLGTCDVVIATEGSSIGMAGPSMIEAAGLGTFAPSEVGPASMQSRNGVIDVLVSDEADAVAAAKKYLAYFQGASSTWEAPDQRLLRHAVPQNRKHVYDVRTVLTTLFDADSVMELRAGFGTPVVTALARLDGQPVGVLANNPAVLGGAIDADAADKAARFLHLCDTFAIPVVSLCDTPGFMVGPESEKQATVRHFSRLFVLAGHLSTPYVTVVLRKAYGLGAMAMAAGGFHNTSMTLAWPTAEFGPMGLEGAVRLSAGSLLDAIDDPVERQRTHDELVAQAYQRGSATNTASMLEIDEVIDPLTTRAALKTALLAGARPTKDGWVNSRRRVGIDTW